MKIAVLADCHIDHGVHGAWADHAWDRATRDIANEEFDAAVVAGDLFHTGKPSTEAALRCASGLRRMVDAGTKVLVIAGNHEWSGVRATEGHRPPVMLFEDIDGVTALISPGEMRVGDVWIGGLPWPGPGLHALGMTQGMQADFLADAAEKADGPTLLVGHAAVGEAMKWHGSEVEVAPGAVTTSFTADLHDLDLEPFGRISLGHVHARQELSDTCAYVGSLEALTFADEGRIGGWSEFRHPGGDNDTWEEIWRPAGIRRFATVRPGDDFSGLEEGTIVRVKLSEGQTAHGLQADIENAGLEFWGFASDGERSAHKPEFLINAHQPEAIHVDNGEVLAEWATQEGLNDKDTGLLAAEAERVVGWVMPSHRQRAAR